MKLRGPIISKTLTPSQKPRRRGGLKQINSCHKVLLQEASLRVCIAFYESYSSPTPPLPLEVAHVQNFTDDDDVALLLSYLHQGPIF